MARTSNTRRFFALNIIISISVVICLISGSKSLATELPLTPSWLNCGTQLAVVDDDIVPVSVAETLGIDTDVEVDAQELAVIDHLKRCDPDELQLYLFGDHFTIVDNEERTYDFRNDLLYPLYVELGLSESYAEVDKIITSLLYRQRLRQTGTIDAVELYCDLAAEVFATDDIFGQTPRSSINLTHFLTSLSRKEVETESSDQFIIDAREWSEKKCGLYGFMILEGARLGLEEFLAKYAGKSPALEKIFASARGRLAINAYRALKQELASMQQETVEKINFLLVRSGLAKYAQYRYHSPLTTQEHEQIKLIATYFTTSIHHNLFYDHLYAEQDTYTPAAIQYTIEMYMATVQQRTICTGAVMLLEKLLQELHIDSLRLAAYLDGEPDQGHALLYVDGLVYDPTHGEIMTLEDCLEKYQIDRGEDEETVRLQRSQQVYATGIDYQAVRAILAAAGQ